MAEQRVRHHRSVLRRFQSGLLLSSSVFAACFGLLLQILIPFVHVPPALADDAASTGLIAATLCQSGQLTLGSSIGDHKNQPEKPAPRSAHPVCPICFSLHVSGSYLLSSLTAFPAPVGVQGVSFYRRPEPVRSADGYLRVRSRGPPSAS